MKQIGRVCASIVSHGHGLQVLDLLYQLNRWSSTSLKKLILTVNSPGIEDPAFNESAILKFSFEVTIIYNNHPLGFGANHNQAFVNCDTEFFCVLNPDLDLFCDPFQSLIIPIESKHIGCTYPIQTSTQGTLLDFERTLVDPWSIIQRHLFRRTRQLGSAETMHWVNGAFMMFRASVFRELSGFDERYFMYCEDVDICLRLQLAGYKLARADATVIHHTQRQTLKNLKHLAWHIRSLLRLWNSAAYKEYKRKFIDSSK